MNAHRENLLFVGLLLKGPQKSGLAQTEAKRVSHRGCRNPSPLALIFCLQGCISRNLDHKGSSQELDLEV